ncbi:MAG TPA: ATP-binding protein, partial [Candidatus Polarisedimenticolaceae bacterium]|nr:ATP-binding protein [Candidatus Polarisedimenticolaceae bacterium]
ELAAECPAGTELGGLRAAAAAPVEPGVQALVAYRPQPDGAFHAADLRFLATLSGHLAVGLERVRLHEELATHGARLEERVAERTAELSRAYAELKQLEGTKQRFLTSMSHEMKTPLTAILSSAVFLRDYGGQPQQRTELLGAIVGSAELLMHQLDGLFRLADLKESAEQLSWGEVQLESLLRESVALAGRGAVRLDAAGAPQRLIGDGSRLTRALANLLDNAFKFSVGKPKVEICVRPAELEQDGARLPAVAISVLDRGPGVRPDDRERIFAPFEQGGDVLTSKPAGVGIGLHEAQRIALRHGGRLEYVPRSGGGSEFRLCLPLEPSPTPVAS